MEGGQVDFLRCPIREIFAEGNRGGGKRLANDQPVLTDRGWVLAGEVTRADRLVAPDGTYTRILGIYPGTQEEYYCVRTEGGASVIACGEHRWATYSRKNGVRDGWQVRTTDELRTLGGDYYLPLMEAPAPGVVWAGLDPYIAGYILGDGTTNAANVVIYTVDQHTIDYLLAAGWRKYDYASQNTVMMACPKAAGREWQALLGRHSGANKRVPEALLMADPATRLALLQGLMDSDGSIEHGARCSFVNTSQHLAEAVQYLVRSMGGKARLHWKNKRSERGGTTHGYWSVSITHAGKFNPFRMPRKAARITNQKGCRDKIAAIEPVGLRDGVCFAVEHPSHLFVTKDFMVTHNTETLLVKFLMHVGQFGDAWQGIIFRREYKHLDDLVAKSKRLFRKLGVNARWLSSKSDYKWVFPTGEELKFRAAKDAEDYWDFHGHEYPFIGWEELTNYPDDRVYEAMRSLNRCSVPGVPRMYLSTGNPFGCVREGEVLTVHRGWVDIRDVQIGEWVVSVNAEGALVHAAVQDVIKKPWAGDLISRRGRGLFMEFTEDHRLPLLNTDQTRHVLREFKDLPGEAILRRTGDAWPGTPMVGFDVPEIEVPRKLKNGQPYRISGTHYAALMGWFLSEGCVIDRDKAFQIAQSKPATRVRLRALLDEIGFKASWSATGVVVYSPRWYEYLKQFGACREKFVPRALLEADEDTLRAFFTAVMDGDGHWSGSDGGQYYTTSKQLADDVSEVAVKLGYRVCVSSRQRPNRVGLSYAVNFSRGAPTTLLTGNHCYGVDTCNRHVNVTRESWAGEVYCLSVPGPETFFIRQQGCVWLSGNSGHGWVKARFLLDSEGRKVPAGVVQVDERGNMRVRLHIDLEQNTELMTNDPEYAQNLEGITNDALRKAWREGDWDIVVGGFLQGIWDHRIHVIPAFDPDKDWPHWRALDWGFAKPFSVGWYAKDPSTSIIYRYRELYGYGGKPNIGSRQSADEVAQMILDLEAVERKSGVQFRGNPADTNLWAAMAIRQAGTLITPAEIMRKRGVIWTPAKKGPGSRVAGAQVVVSLMKRHRFKVTRNCEHFIRTVPVLMPDENNWEDVDSDMEDHAWDECRYALTSRHQLLTQDKPKDTGPKPGTFDWLCQYGSEPASRSRYRSV